MKTVCVDIITGKEVALPVYAVLRRLRADGFTVRGGDDGAYISIDWDGFGSAALLGLTSCILAAGCDFTICCGVVSANLEICLRPFNN